MTDLITNKQDVLKGCRKREDFEGNGFFYNKPICSWGNLCSECNLKLETLNLAIDEQIKLLTDFIKFLNDDNDWYTIEDKIQELTTQLNDLTPMRGEIKAREDD